MAKDVFDRIIQDYKVLNFNSIVHGKKVEVSQPQGKSFEILSPNPSYKYLLESKWTVKPLSDSSRKYLDERR